MNLRGIALATNRIKNSLIPKDPLGVTGVRIHTSEVLQSKLEPLSSFVEVKIPVPWGHISGKWWGRTDMTPIIGLHGFEDNAGTFDRLAPLLTIPSFLALDAPGHGRSSHYPCGMVYTFIDFVITLRRVIQYYGWEKFSIIGHSFGSCMGHAYSSLYPSEIEKFVSLDCARTLMSSLGSKGLVGLPLLRKQCEENLKADRYVDKDPPAYTLEQIAESYCSASMNSIAQDYVQPLIERGATAHPSKANHFFFTRDQKLRYSEFNRLPNDVLKEVAQNMKCEVLTILGTEGFVNMAADQECGKVFFEFEELIRCSASQYERVNVKGTHHVHLNNPERVAPLINKFFDR